MASVSMVALGYSVDLLVHRFWWALVTVPFCFVVFQLVVGLMRPQASKRPHDQIECPSLFMRSRSSCEDQPCVTGDRFVAGFAHQVTADVGAEVEAFNAFAEWCKDQAQDDGHQQKTLDASIASTNAAIENFPAKAESAVRERGEGLQQI